MKNYEIAVTLKFTGYENISANSEQEAINRIDNLLDNADLTKNFPLVQVSGDWEIEATERVPEDD